MYDEECGETAKEHSYADFSLSSPTDSWSSALCIYHTFSVKKKTKQTTDLSFERKPWSAPESIRYSGVCISTSTLFLVRAALLILQALSQPFLLPFFFLFFFTLENNMSCVAVESS